MIKNGEYIFLFIFSIVLQSTVSPYILRKICKEKAKSYQFVCFSLTPPMMLIIISSLLDTVNTFVVLLELLIYIIFLWVTLHKKFAISIFYALFALSFTYFVKLFVSNFILSGLLAINHIVTTMIIGYMSVVPAYYLLVKCMAINPGHLIISEQIADIQQVGGEVTEILSERERNIAKEQHHLIVLSNVLMVSFYLYSNYVRLTIYGSKFNYEYTIFICVFLFIFMLYMINVKYKEWENQRLLRYKDYLVSGLTTYTQEVDKAYQSVRAFHHDFTNILLSMRETIATQEIEDIRRTYADILEKSSIILSEHRQEVVKLSNIKILEVKSVISAKILQAEMQDISIELEVPEVVESLLVDKLDIVRLLGIMLDNAIDEVLALEVDKPVIRLAIFNKGLSRYYVVENKMRQEKLPTNLMLEGGYSTKGQTRGYGLANLDAIVANYPWVSYHIQAKNYVYRVELEMRRR